MEARLVSTEMQRAVFTLIGPFLPSFLSLSLYSTLPLPFSLPPFPLSECPPRNCKCIPSDFAAVPPFQKTLGKFVFPDDGGDFGDENENFSFPLSSEF